MTIEELKHEMYEQLAVIRKARKHPIMLQNFEDDLEAYLEALLQEHGDRLVNLDHANRMVEVYSEAFDGQKLRTYNALCESRRLSDYLWETRRELASVQNDREEVHDKLQEATAKLDSQTQTIIDLHRVIKDQQNALIASQRLLEKSELDRKREQAESYTYAEEAHRRLMQAEGISDEHWEQLETKQKLIISQRREIDALFKDREKLRNQLKKRGFKAFLCRFFKKTNVIGCHKGGCDE